MKKLLRSHPSQTARWIGRPGVSWLVERTGDGKCDRRSFDCVAYKVL
jgi:hypothetical protein